MEQTISGTDTTPWNLLHDGWIVSIQRDEDCVILTVACDYLRERFAEPGGAFVIELRGGVELTYEPSGGEPTSDLAAVVGDESDFVVLSAELEDQKMRVYGGCGVLHLRYETLALRFDSGALLALTALDNAAHGYWDEFSRRHPG